MRQGSHDTTKVSAIQDKSYDLFRMRQTGGYI